MSSSRAPYWLGVFLCLCAWLGLPLVVQAQQECGAILTADQAAYMQRVRDSVIQTAELRGGGTGTVYLPVQQHLVRSSNGLGGASVAEANAVLDTLNYHFSGSGIVFYACGTPQSIHSDQYFQLRNTDEDSLCTPNDVPDVINIYYVEELLVGSMSICGYAYYPGGKNRIIIDADCATNGNTIVHEMGHFLGLRHTHAEQGQSLELVNGSNCQTAGDRFCDTPADPGLSYYTVSSGCIYTGTASDPQGDAYAPATDNFMSYSRLGCRRRFSPEQQDAMLFSARHDRADLACDCHVPQGLQARIQGTKAHLTWESVGTQSDYQVEGGPVLSQQRQQITSRAPLKVVPGLRPNTAYTWRVRARCEDGSITDFSPWAFFQIPFERVAPSSSGALLHAGPIPATDRIHLTWRQENPGLLHMALLRSDGSKAASATRYLAGGVQRLDWRWDEVPPAWYLLVLQAGASREERAIYIGAP